MKPVLISACCVFLCGISLFSERYAPNVTGGQASSANDLTRRMEEAMEARGGGDPVAIGQASQRVIALALVQMAKIRLDAKAYDEAARLCADSLEFEDTPQTHIELAIADLYARKPSAAVTQASIATEMDPQNALAWTIKGDALLRGEDYAGASSALERSIELKQDAEPLYSLGMAQLGMSDKQAAAQSFSRMLALVGNHGWSHVLVGRAYLQQKQSVEAVAEFQTALKLDPDTSNAHYFWARTLLQANDWLPTPEVRSHLHEELRLNPRHFLSNYLLGIFARMERNFTESDRYLQIATGLNPSLPETWMYLGLNARDRNANQSAERYLRKARDLNEKGNPKEHLSVRQAYFVLGRILMSSGRTQEGEKVLKEGQRLQLEEQQASVATMKAKERSDSTLDKLDIPEAENESPLSLESSQLATTGHPNEVLGRPELQLRGVLGSSFNDLATAEALQEKYDLALKHYRQAGNWDARIPGLERNLGLAAFFAGQPAEAVRLLSRVVATTPGDAHARAVLGMAYFATQNFTGAVQTISPIANQALQDPQLGFTWAKSLAKIHSKQRASHALQELDKANPNLSAGQLVQFGQLWQELGDANRAAQSFQRALQLDPGNSDAKCGLRLSKCP